MFRKLAEGLLKKPVELTATASSKSLVITIKPDPTEHGRIIGTAGRNIKCLYAIARELSYRHDFDVEIYVPDPVGIKASTFERFQQNPQFDGNALAELITLVCSGIFTYPVRVEHEHNGGKRHYEVFCSDIEPESDDELLPSLEHLFYAIAKAKGADVKVDVSCPVCKGR
jgi:predicted RNA-binding protein YlqC (UPF0109 family)